MPVLLALLAGCGSPITNAPFLEEAGFQAALPSRARLGPPEQILLAPNAADNPLLLAAKQAAAEYDQLIELPVDVGSALREIPPDERTEVRRAWAPTELVLPSPEALPAPPSEASFVRVWAQAEVIRSVDGDFALTVELSPSAGGAFTQVAFGRENADGTGALVWDFPATLQVLGLPVGDAALVYRADLSSLETEGGEDRLVEVDYGEPPTVARSWTIGGESLLVFTGRLEVSTDGVARPGWALVVHRRGGGWASGAVLDADQERTFEACWDGWGTLTYHDGDAGVRVLGDSSRCVQGALELG